MALILEDGTGLSNSNAYADVATANAYFLERGVPTEWDNADDDEKEYALIRATDYIDATYVFLSVPLLEDQALENPRYGQGDTLKRVLVHATCMLAVILLATPTTTTAAESRKVLSEELTGAGIGTIKNTYALANQDPYPEVSRKLKSVADLRGFGDAGTIRLTK